MKRSEPAEMCVKELVDRFIAIAVEQQDALDKCQTARYNRLYDRMLEIEEELKSREGDQRRALLPLLESRDIQVRMKAAMAVLALAPDRARFWGACAATVFCRNRPMPG